METREYAIITGNGRSGTNWLETILDASPLTHCRSEPYGIPSSPFNRLPQLWKIGGAELEIGRQWDDIVAWSIRRIGRGDHAFKNPKRYVYPLAQNIGIAVLMAHSKSRRVIGLLQPSLRRDEWPMPWWIGNQRRMEQAYAIFKINLDQRIVGWLLANQPLARILHIVRHPCGRLNSWLSRYVAGRNSEQILADRRKRLRKIGEAELAWKEKFGSIDKMSLVESEVWFWRYVNESVHAIGKNYPGYLRVVYEELVHDPLTNAKRAYEFCGLPWDRQVETIVSRDVDASIWGKLPDAPASIARSWRSKLLPEHIRTVERIVRDSPIMAWWPNE